MHTHPALVGGYTDQLNRVNFGPGITGVFHIDADGGHWKIRLLKHWGKLSRAGSRGVAPFEDRAVGAIGLFQVNLYDVAGVVGLVNDDLLGKDRH